MEDHSMNPQTEEKLKELLDILKNRENTFSGVNFAIASVKDGDSYIPYYCIVRFLVNEEDLHESKVFDYSNLLIVRESLHVEKAIEILTRLFTEGIIELENNPTLKIQARLGPSDKMASWQGYGFIKYDWPAYIANGSIENSVNLPQGPINKLGLPMYPDATRAIVHLLGFQERREIYNLGKEIKILVPDYRARISNLRISGTKISLGYEAFLSETDQIVAQFYVKTPNETYTSEEMELGDGPIHLEAKEEPHFIEVHLMSKEDGDIIDRRDFDYRSPGRWQDTVVDNIETQLADLIKNGENDTVEFKLELPKGDSHEFLETIVAFSNSHGGIILLGVDNNCNIAGYDSDPTNTIENLINSHCEPLIKITVKPHLSLRGKEIAMIEVSQGDDKPYILKEKGIYIRSHSSDRQITRYELDQIYSKPRSRTF